MKKLLLIIGVLAAGFKNVKGQVGKSLVLDGATNYMLVAHHNDLNVGSGESLTITFWMKTANTSVGPRLVTKRPEAAPSPGYEVNIQGGNNGKMALNLRENRETSPRNLGTPFGVKDVRDDVWHHVTCVFDQSGATSLTSIYIDGVLDVTSASGNNHETPLNLTNTADLVIGAKSVSYGTKFTGSLDNIRLFRYPMTPTQINADMTAIVSASTPNLIAAWDFENVTGTNVPDVSGNGHTGIISGPVVLPVNFISFNGKAKGNMVQLEWATATEQNNSYFEVERSSSGVDFSTILKAAAKENNTLKQVYQLTDFNPEPGINYYRLKQVDIDGESSYYDKIIAITVLSGKSNETILYPNPASQFTRIKLSGENKATFEVIDLTGAIFPLDYHRQGDEYILNTSTLKEGLYILKAKTDNRVLTEKLMINKSR